MDTGSSNLGLEAMGDPLIAMKVVTQIAGASRAYIYELLRRQQFPAPAVRMGSRFTRWRTSDVRAWAADPHAWIAKQTAASTLAVAEGA
jgi:predicted DNA-binding transcriptional regulator AlpA